MPLDENLNLSILGEVHDNSIQVSIPKLRPFYESLKSGAAKLEVIVDGNVFTPWFDQIEFKEERKVVVESVVENEEKPAKVQIGATLVAEQESSKVVKNDFRKIETNDDYI
jgi:hypothetical protein